MEAAKGPDDPVVPKYVGHRFPPFLARLEERDLQETDSCAPRVFLHATDQSALQNGITMDALNRYAAQPEAAGGGGSLEKTVPITPGVTGGIAKKTH